MNRKKETNIKFEQINLLLKCINWIQQHTLLCNHLIDTNSEETRSILKNEINKSFLEGKEIIESAICILKELKTEFNDEIFDVITKQKNQLIPISGFSRFDELTKEINHPQIITNCTNISAPVKLMPSKNYKNKRN